MIGLAPHTGCDRKRNGKIHRKERRQKMPKIEEILHDSKQLSLKQFAYLCEKDGGGRGPSQEMENVL